MTADQKAEVVEHALAGENWCPAGCHWTTEAVSSSPYESSGGVKPSCCFACFQVFCHHGAFPVLAIAASTVEVDIDDLLYTEIAAIMVKTDSLPACND